MPITAFAFTNAGIVKLGKWTPNNGYVGGKLNPYGGSPGSRLDTVATGTDCTISIWVTLPATITAVIDGGNPVTLTLPANQTFGDVTVFTGLTDAAHTITIYGLGDGFNFVDPDAAFSVTGAAPALAVPAALNGTFSPLTASPMKAYVACSPGIVEATAAGYDALGPGAGAGSGFDLWVDSQIDLPTGSCDTLYAWVYQAGQRLALRVDGINQPTVVVPNTSNWALVTLGTGLPTTGVHSYSIHFVNTPTAHYVYAVLPVGGSGLTGTTPAAVKPTVAFYGDSKTHGIANSRVDSSRSWVHQVGRDRACWVANRGIPGSTLSDTGETAPAGTVQSGEYRLADVTQLQAWVAGGMTNITPTHLILEYGVNDFNQAGGAETAAKYQSSFQTTLTALRAALPSTTITSIGITDYEGGDLTAWRAANRTACAICSVDYRPTDGLIAANYDLYTLDTLHPSDAACSDILVPFVDAVLVGTTTTNTVPTGLVAAVGSSLLYRGTTGVNLYTVIEGPGGVWNGSNYAAYVAANLSTYATATPETPAGSGRYACQFPTSSAAGPYAWATYLRAGASPATSDVCVGSGTGYWDGTTFGGASMVTGSVNSVVTGVTANSIHSGTAQGGSLTTITLDSGASSVSNTYQNCGITLTGGTGAGQSNVIAYQGYVGSTRVATVTIPWATAPDNTTTFTVSSQGAVVMGQLGGATRTVTQDWNGVGSLTIKSSTTGLPIASATLKAYLAAAYAANPSGAQVYGSATTDASGDWSMSLSPAAYTVTVALPGTPTVVSDTFPLTVN